MITNLTKDKNSVEIDESFGEVSNFGIHDPAKAFHAITTQIYKNPEYSVIAEICANAWDSHIKAKNTEKPFNLHIPNNLEPWFSVRDFGTSMSHDFMMNSYTKAFFSTKDKKNTENGAFGIGRLTCLALNDTYTAITYKDGQKHTYSIFKENSIPKILNLSNEQTDESDGFEVIVNIDKKYSYWTFQENASNILSFYPVKPNVSGVADFQIKPQDYSIRINENNLNFGFSKSGLSYIIMGVYSYPIDIKAVDNLSDVQEKLLNKGIHLFVKLGDVSVNLSRDGLFYDQKTKNKILKEIENIQLRYTDIAIKQVESANNYIEALSLYHDNFHHNGSNYYLTGKQSPTIKWNGLEISSNMLTVPAGSKTKICGVTFGDRWSRRKSTNITELEKGIFISKSSNIYLNNDLAKRVGYKGRINKYQEDNGLYNNNFYLFENLDDVFLNTYKLKKEDFVSVESLPKPEYARNSNPEKAKCNIFEYNKGSSSYQSSNWDIPEVTEQNIDDNDAGEGLYLILEDRYQSDIYNLNYKISKLTSIDKNLVVPPIYGIRYKKQELIDKCSKIWTPIKDWIENQAKRIVNDNKDDFTVKTDIQKFLSENVHSNIVYNIEKIKNNVIIDYFLSLKKELESLNIRNYEREDFIRHFGYLFDNDTFTGYCQKVKIAKDLLNKISKHYSLLSKIRHYDVCADELNEYVQAIDQIKGKIEFDIEGKQSMIDLTIGE